MTKRTDPLDKLTAAQAIAKLKKIRKWVAEPLLSVNSDVTDMTWVQDTLSEVFKIEQGWDG